jgi:ABC-type Fe3+-hydroxamate transport system substrate-binding protein
VSRDLRAARLLGLVLLLVLALAGCASSSSAASTSAASSPAAATDRTATLAEVQALHLCAVQQTNFASEGDIKDALVTRLEARGLSYETWRDWHDSLAGSDARAEQLTAALAAPCPE